MLKLYVTTAPLYEIKEKLAEKVECNKCGKCCVLPSGKDCKYLLRLPDGRGHCRIYKRNNRLGIAIGEGQFCNKIMDVPNLFDGCPYNRLKLLDEQQARNEYKEAFP